MKIRFGYVSTALSLWEASPSKTLTFTRWKQLSNEERNEKLYTATKINLENTKRAIYFNAAHGISLYRFSSSLVPLATHPEATWDYITLFSKDFKEIGELVKKFSMRVSFHPSQYTLFTSDKEHITQNAISDMKYHHSMLEAMELEKQSNINIHIGGAYGDKEKTLFRFRDNFSQLDLGIAKIVTFENDDKTYNALETLVECENLGLPFVFDYHHHWANPGETTYEELLPRIFQTWERKGIAPKFHLSSPKSDTEIRSHADYVDVEFAMPFIKSLKAYGEDADIMIEAKAKDKAVLQLVSELASVRGIKRVDGATLELK